jgi:hypothetical protein
MNDPRETPLIDTEKELLGDFFDAWSSMHEVINDPTRTYKEKAFAAQNVAEAAIKVRNYRNPVQGLKCEASNG